jgi:hypothetical protein
MLSYMQLTAAFINVGDFDLKPVQEKLQAVGSSVELKT